jgi:hypothetical protein
MTVALEKVRKSPTKQLIARSAPFQRTCYIKALRQPPPIRTGRVAHSAGPLLPPPSRSSAFAEVATILAEGANHGGTSVEQPGRAGFVVTKKPLAAMLSAQESSQKLIKQS